MLKFTQKNSVVFCKTKDKYGGLSNMCAGYPIEVNGLKFKTSEALYQALRFPNAPEVQKKIYEAKSPMTAKMICRENINQGRNDWEQIKVDVMRWCLRAKLICNWQTLGELLESTGELDIVELSYKDEFWGAKPDRANLVGYNVLGRLLMELRKDYRKTGQRDIYVLEPLIVKDFLLENETISKIVIANN